MRTFALPSKRAISILLSLVFNPANEPAYAAEIPVKEIILYKHGIGYFEREGTVPATEETRLDFKATDMNDVLKSLTVQDSAGGRVRGIRFDSNETLEQQLDKYPFKIGDGEFLSTFLDRIKGARIELRAGERPVSGSILGARSMEVGGDNDKRTLREQVTLLLDSGTITNFELTPTTPVRLLDPRLQVQLKQYLETLAQTKSREKRSIYIDSVEHGNRNLRISYIVPTPIWKSSYRLSLNDEGASILEGWAIVDNTSGEDWNDVRLSVVSGRPISFISLLDTPRYGKRQVAELPEDRAAGPVVYAGSVDTVPGAGLALAQNMGVQPGSGTGLGGGVGGGVYHMNGAPMADRNGLMPKSFTQLESLARVESVSSTVEGATGAALGELFEYNFAGPVTIKKDQSAMLPFLQDKINARKLLIYTERDGEHPVNAAEVVNNTSKTLDGGPITIYDSGAYAGEALVETFKTGDKRLIGYAVDYGTRITSSLDSREQTIREIHVRNGVLEVRSAQHQTRAYTIRNVDAKPKDLMIQQEGISQYTILSPKPVERTATAYRFEVKVAGESSQTLKVEQEQLLYTNTTLVSATPDFLLTIVQNKELSGEGRKQVGDIAQLKRQIADVEAGLETTKSQTSDLTDDQTRLRQNIDSLNRVKNQDEQVRKYSGQLADNEAQLAKLRDQKRDLTLRKTDLDSKLKTAIDGLEF